MITDIQTSRQDEIHEQIDDAWETEVFECEVATMTATPSEAFAAAMAERRWWLRIEARLNARHEQTPGMVEHWRSKFLTAKHHGDKSSAEALFADFDLQDRATSLHFDDLEVVDIVTRMKGF